MIKVTPPKKMEVSMSMMLGYYFLIYALFFIAFFCILYFLLIYLATPPVKTIVAVLAGCFAGFLGGFVWYIIASVLIKGNWYYAGWEPIRFWAGCTLGEVLGIFIAWAAAGFPLSL